MSDFETWCIKKYPDLVKDYQAWENFEVEGYYYKERIIDWPSLKFWEPELFAEYASSYGEEPL